MLLILIATFLASPAHSAPETYEAGLRALNRLSLGRGNEVSRTFFWQSTEAQIEAEWGAPVEGDEAHTGIDENDILAKINRARALPAKSVRVCNFHTHRKGAELRFQKERHEFPKQGNRSFPPSGADLQISLVGKETWLDWKLEGESAMGVVDSLGVWLFRELGNSADQEARLALYKKFGFTDSEIETTRNSKVDASEEGRYEYMKAVNMKPLGASEILLHPAYRKLVLQYAVLEDVELVFLPLEVAVKSEPCRGF